MSATTETLDAVRKIKTYLTVEKYPYGGPYYWMGNNGDGFPANVVEFNSSLENFEAYLLRRISEEGDT